MYVNSTLKATETTGQRKAFYRQRIPESSHPRNETVDTDIQKCCCRIGKTELYQLKCTVEQKQIAITKLQVKNKR